MIGLLLVAVFSGTAIETDWSVEAMAQVMAQRRAALNRIEFTAQSTSSVTRPGTDPLDDTEWEAPVLAFPHEHFVAVAWPVVYHHVMTDQPEYGYRPIELMTNPTGLLGRFAAAPEKDYRTVFYQHPGIEYDVYRWLPLPAILDTQLRECPARLTLLDLFSTSQVALVSHDADRAVYAAHITPEGVDYDVIVELDSLATPLRVQTTITRPQRTPWTVTQQTRTSVDIGGYRFPVDTVFITDNPTVQQNVPGMSGRSGVEHIVVTSVSQNPSLDASTLGFEVVRNDAKVLTISASGEVSEEVYDGAGCLIAGSPIRPENGIASLSTESLRYRWVLIVASFGCMATLCLVLVRAYIR